MVRDPANLNEILTQAVELFETQASTQGVKIAHEFEQDLPFYMADRKRLHRCFSNLISNAIQAMPAGGDVIIRTRVVATMPLAGSEAPGSRPEPVIQVSVSDTGQGIPADRLSRIFDPFYTTKEKGMGLGMAITHRIVEDHKGSIDVKSEVGLGTTFTLHFPLET